MANYKFFSIGKANTEIAAADAAINPALASAGITNITVEGKAVPASDAPLAAKISALLAVAPPGAAAASVADVIVSNDALAKELETITSENALNKASVQSMTLEVAKLKADLATSQLSVQSLTASNAEQANRLTASNNQVTATQNHINRINSQISKVCLAAGVLDLSVDGKALPEDAPEAHKLAVADQISIEDKLTAYQGAISAALSKVGVSVAAIPGSAPKTATIAGLGNKAILAQYDQITDPTERTAFYRKNKTAIDAAFRD